MCGCGAGGVGVPVCRCGCGCGCVCWRSNVYVHACTLMTVATAYTDNHVLYTAHARTHAPVAQGTSRGSGSSTNSKPSTPQSSSHQSASRRRLSMSVSPPGSRVDLHAPTALVCGDVLAHILDRVSDRLTALGDHEHILQKALLL